MWSLWITATAMLALILAYHTTIYSMVGVWRSSDTFTHSFFVLPISLWLIWQKREQLFASKPESTYSATFLLAILGFVWLIAAYADVQVVQQLAMVSMIPVIVLAILGWQSTKIILFPLIFLFFSVPLGEELVPDLIEFTANFAVMVIKLVGIPVYQEGSYIQLPSGNWSVVKTCSGVRYLIASAVLGVLYAYLNYVTFWKRAVFVVFSLVIPVIANGMRAAMIVLIGHYSDMKLATGIDHLIYGWVFFGLIMLVMFYVGSFFREEKPQCSRPVIERDEENALGTKTVHKQIAGMFIVIFMVSIWPIKYFVDDAGNGGTYQPRVITIPEIAGWNAVGETITDWRPAYNNLDGSISQSYENGESRVMLYIGYYHQQRQGGELVNYNNVLVRENDKVWRIVNRSTIDVDLLDNDVTAYQTVISSNRIMLSVLSMYHVNGKYLSGQLAAKLEEVKARLLGRPTYGALIISAAEVAEESDNSGFNANKKFLHDAAGAISGVLQAAYDQ